MNVDQTNEPVRNIYDILSQIQELMKIFARDFKVDIRDLDYTVQLPQNKIDELKAKYSSLQEALVREANRVPKLERLG